MSTKNDQNENTADVVNTNDTENNTADVVNTNDTENDQNEVNANGLLNKKCLFSLILSGVMLALAVVMAILHKQLDWYVVKVFGVVVAVMAIQVALCVFDLKWAAWTAGGLGVALYVTIPVGVLLLNFLGFYGVAHIKSQTYG